MTTRIFTIDPSRLQRYRTEADTARAAAMQLARRVADARDELGEAEQHLHDLERQRPIGGRAIVRSRSPDLETRIEATSRRVERAREALAELLRAQGEGASRREHAGQLAARLDAYSKENGDVR